jgi:UDP-2,3-diacylglucosamine hydrolase
LNHLVGGDVLLLGGDIFDLLVGNKRLFRDRFAPIIDAINSAATRGILVHYLEGNHDFHFQGIFSPLVIIHTDDFTLDVFERRIYISHGDLIDPEDRNINKPIARVLAKPYFQAVVSPN